MRAFIKDATDLSNVPKAFLRVTEYSISEDLLTSASSSFGVDAVPTNVNTGDIILIVNEYGIVIYKGVVKTLEDSKISATQIQSFYKGMWAADVHPSTYIEDEIAYLFTRYSQGYTKGSNYQDPFINLQKGGFTITTGSSTLGSLETPKENSSEDFEQWMYSIYKNYGIMFNISIPYSGTPSVAILKPSYTTIKLGNNNNAVVGFNPITEINETNKLIVYSRAGVYRNTSIVRMDGAIVREPSSYANRFNVTSTKVVYSDDSLDILEASNLPKTMYNHKITFTLRLDNKLYQFDDLKLGTPVQIWIGSDYYASVITGRSYSNQNEVYLTCGMVRQAITKKLKMAGVI